MLTLLRENMQPSIFDHTFWYQIDLFYKYVSYSKTAKGIWIKFYTIKTKILLNIWREFQNHSNTTKEEIARQIFSYIMPKWVFFYLRYLNEILWSLKAQNPSSRKGASCQILLFLKYVFLRSFYY